MNRALVRLLIWFFIAALPVQGFAAAARACCGQMQPGDHGAMQMGAHVAIAPPGASGPPHCAGMAGQRAGADATDAVALADADAAAGANAILADAAALAADAVHAAVPARASHTSHAAPAASACSACAACGIAAWSAMPQTLAVTPILFSSVKIVLAPAPLLTGHIPAGLERPPRLTFAV